MYCLRNKIRLSSIVVTMVGLLLTLAAGCEPTQDARKPDDSKSKKLDDAADKKPQPSSTGSETTQQDQTPSDKPAEPQWIDEAVVLFDGKSLDDWETIEFGGEGDVTVENGILEFLAGDPFTGISSISDSLPKTNFELSLEARKMEGTDFFCGLTFPVADSHCTLIVGGWGGATVGLSCIDDKDASSNDSCTYMKFEKGQWYKIRVRVQPEAISVWIDDKQLVNQNIAGKNISLRGDTELCKPMGLCSFMTVAEYKNIRLREFKPREFKPMETPNKTVLDSIDESKTNSESVKEK